MKTLEDKCQTPSPKPVSVRVLSEKLNDNIEQGIYYKQLTFHNCGS